MIIKSLSAKKILDSRKQPTIQVTVNNSKASSPSGKSTGKYETSPYQKNLNHSIKQINSLKIPFSITKFQDLKKLEAHIKKTFNLKNPKEFGANALFALESAVLKSLATEKNTSLYKIINPKAKNLPVPVGNAIGGGLHSLNKNKPEFQEFLIIPKNKSIKQNIKILNEIYKKLKIKLEAKNKNDEGAWETSLAIDQILRLLKSYKNINLGVDIAASTFYKNSEYHYKNKSLNSKAQIHYINSLIKDYNLLYIEDPLQEKDFKGFSKLKRSSSHLIVGDDLTATQIPRLKKSLSSNAINAMVIKPNQNGSLIELQKIFQICKKNKIKTILSHRSGETLDSAIADYSVAFEADFIKTGISTLYRKSKLNRLIEISKGLN